MDALTYFEIVGDLYYRRYGDLRPGKSDPLKDSNSAENRIRFQGWKGTHAFGDAIERINALEIEVEHLKGLIDAAATSIEKTDGLINSEYTGSQWDDEDRDQRAATLKALRA